ncbi:helix-turn-helix domain-containing protein [Streptomyces sp. NPDC092952]|uniref:helix-turn-helix domain-containing protein n=1 Tax=Streptomyces sp. NPDC092952 TaxID=3366018 RepID=UPI0037F8C662
MDEEARPERPAEEDGTAHLFKALGKMIKQMRENLKMSQRQLAADTHVSEDLISSMERGVRTPQPDFLDLADDVLGAQNVLRASIEEVREALAKARTRHPDWYRGYAALERAAAQINDYNNQAIPGLLQTEAYARAIFSQRRPLLSEAIIEKRIADRLDRQRVFERWPSPEVHFILDESVLMRPIGGRDVHREQLGRLLEIGRLRTVNLQVMPLDRIEQPSIDGPFTLLTQPGKQQLGYLEIHGNPKLVVAPEEVRVLAARYGIMQSVALTPGESAIMIEKMRREL